MNKLFNDLSLNKVCTNYISFVLCIEHIIQFLSF